MSSENAGRDRLRTAKHAADVVRSEAARVKNAVRDNAKEATMWSKEATEQAREAAELASGRTSHQVSGASGSLIARARRAAGGDRSWRASTVVTLAAAWAVGMLVWRVARSPGAAS
ncbi:hypothetical protein [Streptacidiphilus jiangxiensis]|uniref:DUF3618 domain-containing protein n=1 Tax=Streptacidiphilus jiangxiensis TaxID=235985 RepID=A0A1H7H9R9_STRJI|nr:hypothetical protein [Streptacidiphilus jiangxiensis]SEK44845.1 hypothetical protein SAMN05414137_10262 [Streptacidiphilus jiangxiensis]